MVTVDCLCSLLGPIWISTDWLTDNTSHWDERVVSNCYIFDNTSLLSYDCLMAAYLVQDLLRKISSNSNPWSQTCILDCKLFLNHISISSSNFTSKDYNQGFKLYGYHIVATYFF